MENINIILSKLTSLNDDRYISLKDCLQYKALGKYEIPIVLGKDNKGNIHIKDLKELGSILISGTTWGGKSVFLNSFINTILLTKTEKEVKLLFIDPKMVEMSIYENIPHNIFPIVYDTKKASDIFTWCIEEIERRELKKDDKQYIVIVADEYEDTMLSEDGVEEKLCIIASKGKKVGIFMILSSARASDTIITEKLKNAIKTRIAFSMASKTDSVTLLDEEGGEELFGRGDMIFKSENEKIRAQAPWISTEDIEKIVKKVNTRECICDKPECMKCLLTNCNDDNCKVHTKENKKKARKKYYYPRIKELIKSKTGMTPEVMKKEFNLGYKESGDLLNEFWDNQFEEEGEEGGTLYEYAKKLTIENKKASASFLQRKLAMSYNCAAKLIDKLEKNGVVGPQIGVKPREVLIKEYISNGVEIIEKRDPLFEDAKRVIQEYGKASVPLLQRKLKIGWNRAARLFEELKDGVSKRKIPRI